MPLFLLRRLALAALLTGPTRFVGFEAPRAAELLALVGQDPASTAPCLDTGADGGGAGVGDAGRAVALERCSRALAAAGGKLTRGKSKAVGKCLRGVEECLFADPAATAAGLDAARGGCARAIDALTRPGNGVEAKLVAAIAAACDGAGGSFSDVLAADGLGYQSLAPTCAALGVSTLDSDAALADCVRRQHECRVEQWLERETPRLRELIQLGARPLP